MYDSIFFFIVRFLPGFSVPPRSSPRQNKCSGLQVVRDRFSHAPRSLFILYILSAPAAPGAAWGW